MKITPEIPTILVVLGATGDLMKKKIVPSVCHLYINKRLPRRFCVVGMARRPLKDSVFQQQVRTELKIQLPDAAAKTIKDVAALFTYHQGEFDDQEAFTKLHTKLEKIDIQWGVCSNKIFFLAVPPAHFENIFKNMSRAHLNVPCGGKLGWTRLLIEKPFGENFSTAKRLFTLLGKHFKEEQLYLIDHYLAKNIVQAIMDFRFSNNLFEKSWDNGSIERIDIRLLEAIGVEGRGAFYDTLGAFRDVGENHLLQMLAAVTMDLPRKISSMNVRQRRAEIMETLKKWNLADIRQKTFRAQYDGYRSITDVHPKSVTETYFKIQTELTHPAWRGVPITIESGKQCIAPRKEVVVTFKRPGLCGACRTKDQGRNRVVFSIEPQEKISIYFWTNKSGFEEELEERTFDFFLYERAQKLQYVEEYAELIFDCLLGNQTMFVSEREILAQWRFTDPIVTAWKKKQVALNRYAPGTDEMIQASASIGVSHPVEDMIKDMAIVGLGKMGANMAQHMLDQGWRVVGFNRSAEVTKNLAKEDLVPAYSLKEMAEKLPHKKVVWLMVPAGNTVDEVLFGQNGLVNYLKKGDLIIDGGNSFYKDTILRAKKLESYGIRFLDCGTSGGPEGARHGACLMVGGKHKDFKAAEMLFRDFALPGAYQFFEGSGAGHFLKMIHNGIEYGMMQAIAEGFTILQKASFKLDLTRVCDIYNHGSVIQSRLIGWLKDAFDVYGAELKPVSGTVEHSGEGAWTVKTAKEMNVMVKVISEALLFRYRSQKNPNFTGQVVSAMRGQFGGHPVLRKDKIERKKFRKVQRVRTKSG